MTNRRGVLKIGAILWAIFLGAGLVALAGSLLLPSTKRARVDFDKLYRQEQEAAAAVVEPSATPPATRPTTQP